MIEIISVIIETCYQWGGEIGTIGWLTMPPKPFSAAGSIVLCLWWSQGQLPQSLRWTHTSPAFFVGMPLWTSVNELINNLISHHVLLCLAGCWCSHISNPSSRHPICRDSIGCCKEIPSAPGNYMAVPVLFHSVQLVQITVCEVLFCWLVGCWDCGYVLQFGNTLTVLTS